MNLGNLYIDVQMQDNENFEIYISFDGDSGCYYKNLTAKEIGEMVTREIEYRKEMYAEQED